MTDTTTTHRRTTAEGGSQRVPPHSIEAERALLGALMLAPQRYAEVAAVVGAVDFYKSAHAATFAAIARLSAEGAHVDALTVRDTIGDESAVALVDLLDMETKTPATSGAIRYATIIAEDSQLRRALALAGELTAAAYEARTETVLALISDAPNRVGQPKGHVALEWEPLGAALRGEEPEVVPDLLYRSDGKGLVYPGRLHWIQAEPGRAKSWVALICVLEQLTFGEHVVYLDYESNRADVGKRLRKLGLEADIAEDFLHYARPGAHTPAVTAQLAADIERWRPALCVLDGVAKSLQRNGYKENDRDEVGIWVDTVCRPITNQGVALIAIDHVTKNPESRGRYAVGGGNKLAEVDGAAYSMKRVKALSHSQAGEYQLIVEKDKEGSVAPEGTVAAVLYMEEASERITHRLDAPTEENTEHPGMRIIRERIVAFLTARPTQEFSGMALEGEIRGKGSAVRECLAQLVERGDVECRRQGRSVLHRIAENPPGEEF